MRAYSAERRVFKRAKRVPADINLARTVVERLCTYFGDPIIPKVRRIHGQRGFRHDGGTYYRPNSAHPTGLITLGDHAPLWVVVHEAAHHLSRGTDRGHGPQFARTMVECSRVVLGRYYANRLQREFEREGLYRKELHATATIG